MKFHPLTIDDAAWMLEVFSRGDWYSSDYGATICYAWANYFHTEIARLGEWCALRFDLSASERVYLCPVGRGDFNEVMEDLKTTERAEGGKKLGVICTESQKCLFSSACEVVRRRDLDNYIYTAKNLIDLPGSAYHGKRNLIAQFKKKYDWRFAPLTNENAGDCLTVERMWLEQSAGNDSEQGEWDAIGRMLNHAETLQLLGGILYVEDQPIAFSLGSCPRPFLLDTHIEKADTAFTGAYPMVMREFTQYAHSVVPFTYVNREEDMGIENLRRAKLMLHPEFLDKRYQVFCGL